MPTASHLHLPVIVRAVTVEVKHKGGGFNCQRLFGPNAREVGPAEPRNVAVRAGVGLVPEKHHVVTSDWGEGKREGGTCICIRSS